MSGITSSDQESSKDMDLPYTIQFLVGSGKVPINLDREKLKTYTHSIKQYDGRRNFVNMQVDSFKAFKDMVEGKGIRITSPTIALDLVAFSEKICCLKLHYACNEYLRINYKCDRAMAIYQHARNNGLPELEKNCLEYLKENYELLMGGEDFINLSIGTIEELFSCDGISANEEYKLKVLLSYAKHHDKIRFEDIRIKALLDLEEIDCLLSDSELLNKVKKIIKNSNHFEQTISFIFEVERISNTDTDVTYTRDFSFSEDLFLKRFHMDDAIMHRGTNITFEIDHVATPYTIIGCCVVINRDIKKGSHASMKIRTNESIQLDCGMHSGIDVGAEIKINPSLNYFHFTRHMEIKRFKSNKPLVVDCSLWKGVRDS